MSRKTIKGFSELRAHWKKTETDAEAKAVIKGGEFHTRKLPKRPVAPVKNPRSNISANDQFIVDTLEIQLECLPLDQLYDARLTIIDAMECVSDCKISIQDQLDSKEDSIDDQGRSWKTRATAALRFKIQEGQALKKKIAAIDDLIARKKPPLKLVTPTVPPVPTTVAPYQIHKGIPLPNPRGNSSNEWRKYPFDKLVEKGDCFPFAPGISASQVRTMITAAQRALGTRIAYRTKNGVIWVWFNDQPPITRNKK